jgi:hypothetical protein
MVVDEIPKLAFDHNVMIENAIKEKSKMSYQTCWFDLLPKNFFFQNWKFILHHFR